MSTTDARGRLVRYCLTAGAALAILAGARPVAGQERPSVRFHVTADAGVSLRDGIDGPRLGRDMVTYGLRLTAARRGGLHPWVDAGRFRRPAFECVSGLDCTDAGWLARAGVAMPLSPQGAGPGLSVEARTGLGAGFADEASLSYLVGFALLWRASPRIAPLVEVRWEHIAGMNIAMLAAGVRLGL